MLFDDQFDTFNEARFPQPVAIRRLENGAIDIDHYARIGRGAQGVPARNPGWNYAGVLREKLGHAGKWWRTTTAPKPSPRHLISTG